MPDFNPSCRCPGCGTCSAAKEKALTLEEMRKLTRVDFSRIEALAISHSGNQAFLDAQKFVDEGKTPEARQARKQALFVRLYGSDVRRNMRG
jgi:hypothetical protein